MERLLPQKETKRFNQGLMDIGALLCTPRNPRCHDCPLSSLCLAFERGIQHRIPPLKKAHPLPCRERAVAVIRGKESLLIHRRPSQGLLGGLWEFPGLHLHDTGSVSRLLPRMLERECGLCIQLQAEIFSFFHEYTHFKERIRVFLADCPQAKDLSSKDFRWVGLEEIEQFPLPASHRRIAQVLSEMGDRKWTRSQSFMREGGK